MNRTSKAILFAVVAIISIVSVVFMNAYRQINQRKSFIMSNKPTVPIIVLHQDQLIQDPKNVHQLEDDYLFLIVKKNNSLYLFTKLEQLRPYDLDNDNMVDSSDPIFHDLYVGTYDKKTKMLLYHPIEKTAIRAIRLDVDNHDSIVTAQAIYTGNHQQRSISGLSISAKQFPKEVFSHLKLKPRQQLTHTGELSTAKPS